MRLRQVCLIARDLDPVVGELCAALGVEVGFRDPAVAEFGLHNAVMPVGDTFLEVVSPLRPDTAGGHFLQRHGGDWGYMVILQSADLDADRARLERLGVRVVWKLDLPDIRGTHLHPRDVGGAILSLDAAEPPAEWRWAGPEWKTRARTADVREIVGADLQAADPEALARRWAEVLDRPATPAGDERWEIRLDRGALGFVADEDGRGDGLCAVVVEPARSDWTPPAGRICGVEIRASEAS